MKFPGYFLIVADFIKWAKAQGIPVGPGRGSGAGSVVAWALTITDLDPLRFGLLFERFLNPERVSMPDFDIDFCQDRRDEVIRYVQRKYGHDRVAQIITHGKLQARAVLRDVGRVLQMPYGQVDRLCKLVPNNPANPVTLPEAIAGEPKLQEQIDADPMVARLVEIAQKLEGLYRHASTHAAGMVIGDRPLVELVPLTRDPKTNSPVTQFNWKLVEAAGLVKFDFLGLKTLTVLQKAVELVKRGRGIDVDLLALPFDDPKAFEILAKADTVGVFQLESTGMRESLKRLKPDRFEDIIAMVALYRPGPMDNIPTYINRKHGEEPIDCLHPLLEPILKETYGVIIYQEQVIQIAQVMGGFTLGQADNLRRAMGKKDKAGMAKEQARFVAGAVQKGVKKNDAAYIFELVDKFAGYGFNKSPRRRLRAGQLSHRLHEGELPRGIPRRLHDARHEQHRQAGAVRLRGAAQRHLGAAAVRQRLRGRLPRRAVEGSRQAGRHPLFARRPEEHRRRGRRHGRRRARPTRAASRRWPTSPRGSIRRRSTSAASKRWPPPAPSMRWKPTARWCTPTSRASWRWRSGATPTPPPAPTICSASAQAAPSLDLRPAQAWTPMERLSHEFDAVGFYLSGHPLDQYELALKKLGVKTLRRVRGDDRARRVQRAARRHRHRGARAPLAEGQQVRLRHVLRRHRAVRGGDLLRHAGDGARSARAGHAGAARRVGRARRRHGEDAGGELGFARRRPWPACSAACKIVLDRRLIEKNSGAVAAIKSRLKPGGKGEIRLVLPLGDRGKELELVVAGPLRRLADGRRDARHHARRFEVLEI